MSSVRRRRDGARARTAREGAGAARHLLGPARVYRAGAAAPAGGGTHIARAHRCVGGGAGVRVRAPSDARLIKRRVVKRVTYSTSVQPWYRVLLIDKAIFLYTIFSRVAAGVSLTLYTRSTRLDATHARHVVRTHRTKSIKKGSAAKGEICIKQT